MRNKILMTLALLITAASGAWADELTVCDGTAENSHVPVYGFFGDGLMKSEFVMPATDLSAMNGKAITSMTFYAQQETADWGTAKFQVFMTEVASTSISAFNGLSNIVYEGTLGITNHQMTVTFTTPYNYHGGNLLIGFYKPEYAGSYMASKWYGIEANGASVEGFKGTGTFDEISANQENFLPKTTFTYGEAVPEVEVTTNKAENETTFTEASFTMPDFDATVKYEIVRDLEVQTAVNVIIGSGNDAVTVTENTRLRIAKNEQEVYVPVKALNCSFYDEIEDLSIAKEDFANAKLVPQFYLKGEGDAWTLVTDINTVTHLPNNIAPEQTYRLTLAAADGSYYDGETLPSVEITLFEGYELTIPGKEFVTFYAEDPIYADDVSSADAELYTIASVSGTQATLSDQLAVVPANVPMLVYNPNDEEKTFLLLPSDQEPLGFMYYGGFYGTLEATTLAASDETTDNYAFNGKQFVWVKNDIPVAANKCWLAIPKASSAKTRAITLVFDETTGLKAVDSGQLTDDTWYDLNGRKLSRKPTTKGVYIWKGKKVVVR